MQIVNFFRQLKKKIDKHQPLIEVLVYRKNLLHNLAEFRKVYPQLEFAPVLKSNAYGHGLVEVAEILKHENIPFLVVDSVFEARQLRHAGIKTKILIIGYVRPTEILASHLKNVAFTITNLEQLQEIFESKVKHGPIKIHLKIDTCMHRQGILLSEIETAIKIITSNRNIILEGLCSHLAAADSENSVFTLQQIENWNNTVKILCEKFADLKYFHLAASAGAVYTDKINANVVRLGIGLYGFGNLYLEPVLEMRTMVTAIKTVEANEKVGYDTTFTAPQKMVIATLPAGYFEGIDRRLSNLGCVKIKDKFCPIIGRVSMNITTVDVSAVSDVKVGDAAIIISANSTDKNSVANIAQQCQTIPYEILVHIPQHLKRIVI